MWRASVSQVILDTQIILYDYIQKTIYDEYKQIYVYEIDEKNNSEVYTKLVKLFPNLSVIPYISYFKSGDEIKFTEISNKSINS